MSDLLPAFADGGQLTVTGSGGTNSQLVQFNATPGEVVTVSTPGQMAQTASGNPSGGIQGLTTIQGQSAAGVISATPDPSTQATVQQITDAIGQSSIDITKEIDTGNNNIVDALNKLIGGVAQTTVNPATGLPISSGSTSSSGANPGSGLLPTGSLLPGRSAQLSGGGFNTKSGGGMGAQAAKDLAQDIKDNPPLTAQQAAMYGAGATIQRGTATPTRRLTPARFPSGSPTGMFGSGIPTDSGISAGANYQAFGPGDSFDTGYASVGSPSAAAYNDYGYAGSGFPGSDYSTGGDFGVTGSTALDVATQYMGNSSPFDSSGVFDYTAGGNDFTGGDFSTGYATGGSFLVGGDGGIDTTPVSFMATKGERVTITPPNSVANPSSSSADPSAPTSSQPNSSAGSTTKIVNMYLHSSVQANDILRSRAQIIRGMT